MNTKFTKGPWQINDRDPSQICDSDGDGRGCAPIVNVRGTAAEQKANAALIASAPELYEALAMLAEYPLEAFGKENSKPDTPLFGANGWTLTVGDVLNARAVLKKARGEA